ncbi:MAG: HEAT repeat domain-containing protein [Myxococcales bacterium]|nr:HEAT repeat domain-containing protein [Myxococcales bacterium]
MAGAGAGAGARVAALLACAMALELTWELAAYARLEVLRAGLFAPEREAILAHLVGDVVGEEARLCAAGLAFLRPGSGAGAVPVDDEVRAAIASAALPFSSLVVSRGRDARAAQAIAFGGARAVREGQTVAEVLAALAGDLPHEGALRLAALLRIEVVAEAGGAAGEAAIERAAAAAVELLAVGAPEAIISRACSALAGLGLASPGLRNKIFSDAVLRMFAALRDGAETGGADSPVDLVVQAILAGGEAADPALARLEPFERYAAHHAWLVGRLAAASPSFWPELWREVQEHHGGHDFVPLPTLLGGLGEGGGPSVVVRETLIEAARASRETVRQTALASLAARQDEHPSVSAALAAAVRDPDPSVRVEVAAALLRGAPSLAPILRRLCEDPSPAVRAAAAWSTLARDEVTEDLLALVDDDLHFGAPGTRYGAALAAACLGGTDEAIGELLHVAGGIPAESGPEWSGLERWASPAFPFAVWASSRAGAALLHARAAEDDDWLLAFGAALGAGWRGVPDAEGEWREPVRIRALRLLPSDDVDVRTRAALVLGRHASGDRQILEALCVAGRPPVELLEVLAVASAEIGLEAPAMVARLRECLDEDADEEEVNLALTCLGELAPADDPEVTELLVSRIAEVRGETTDAAYEALARMVARRR